MFLSEKQRKLLSSGFINLGNIAAAVLIFGQFVSEKAFHSGIFVYGLITLAVCYITGVILSRGGEG